MDFGIVCVSVGKSRRICSNLRTLIDPRILLGCLVAQCLVAQCSVAQCSVAQCCVLDCVLHIATLGSKVFFNASFIRYFNNWVVDCFGPCNVSVARVHPMSLGMVKPRAHRAVIHVRSCFVWYGMEIGLSLSLYRCAG